MSLRNNQSLFICDIFLAFVYVTKTTLMNKVCINIRRSIHKQTLQYKKHSPAEGSQGTQSDCVFYSEVRS